MTKEEFKKVIMKNFLKGKNIVFVNVGTDKYIGDSFAPLLGSMIQDQVNVVKIYGTLDNLINGVNLVEKVNYINKIHKNDFIIGVDSALATSDYNCAQDFVILNEPLLPGEGIDVVFPEVGSVCIQFCIKEENEDCFEDLRKQTIKEIYNRSKAAANFIFEIDEELSKIIKNRQEVK